MHIPKNGGETIDLMLGIPKDHSPACLQRQRLGVDAWNHTPFRFAVVRNPWGRMVSWYAHLRKHTYMPELRAATSPFGKRGDSFVQLEKGDLMRPVAHRKLAVVSSFPVWVKRVLTDPAYTTWSAVGQLGVHNTQMSMLTDPASGELIVTHVYTFEAFGDALADICMRTGSAWSAGSCRVCLGVKCKGGRPCPRQQQHPRTVRRLLPRRPRCDRPGGQGVCRRRPRFHRADCTQTRNAMTNVQKK